jgi:thiosulfate reductase cytochrome b subunit
VAVLTGLTMSPAVAAAMPWLLDVFAGRQTARTIHFVVTWLLVGFTAGHVAMVTIAVAYQTPPGDGHGVVLDRRTLAP